MTMNLRTILAGALGLALAASAMTVQAKIYRWTDSNNVVHFSQVPPQNQNATVVNDTPISTISGSPAMASSNPLAASTTQQSAKPTSSTTTQTAANQQALQKSCAVAHTNLAALQSNQRVNVKLPDGSTHWLNASERKTRLKETNDFLTKYCK